MPGVSNRYWVAVVLATLAACTEKSPTTPPPPPTCEFAVAPAEADIAATGGTAIFQVTTTGSCAWTAQAQVSWLVVTSGQSVTGPGAAGVTVAPNASNASRTGMLTIAGATVVVRQAGQPTCTFEVDPLADDYGADGGRGTLTISAPAPCLWQAVSNSPWIVVTSGATGTGPGTATFEVAPNGSPVVRDGTLTVAGRTVSIEQEGDLASCEYQVAPVTLSTCMAWSTDLISTVQTQSGCPWTAVSTQSWITVVDGAEGEGPGSIRLRGPANYDARRSGIVEVRWPAVTAGQNLVVDQAGCSYGVSQTVMSFTAAATTGRFDVVQQSDPQGCGGALQNACVWSAVSTVSWITITSAMPRTGDDPVNFTVADNASTTPRVGTITVRDRVVIITQAGR